MPRRTTIKLTERVVNNLTSTLGDRPQIYWDADLKGFGVLVSGRTGQKTYVVERGTAVPRRSIGRWNVVSLAEARKEAERLIPLLNAGIDPKREARKHREAAEAEAFSRSFTLAAALQAYLDSPRGKKLRESSRREYQEIIRNYLTEWVERPLSEITPEMVVARHGQIAAEVRDGQQRSATTGQASANKVMRGLRAIWNNALLFQLVPGLGSNPTLLLRAAGCWFDIPRRRTRVRDQDLRNFYAAAMRLDNTTARDLVLTLLFTGLRVGEAAAIQWPYVDLTSRMISIPPSETKTGNQTQEPSVIPMSDFVTDVLRARPVTGPYVFPARGGGPISGARDALDEIRRTAGLLYSVTHHDLRRTFATVASSVGISEEVIGRLLNHAKRRTVTAGYIVEDPAWLLGPAQTVTDRLKALCGMNLRLLTGVA